MKFRFDVVARIVLIGAWCCCGYAPVAVGQNASESESAATESTDLWIENHSPRRALRQAAAIPGWGQAYNRQYLKIPVVYAGIGGLIFNSIRLNDKYLLYRHAFQFKAFEEITAEGETNPKASLEADYIELTQNLGVSQLSSSSIRPTRDRLRRNRDLSILGAGLAYALSIVDAYVSAHLLDFDIDEDLIVEVRPTLSGVRTSLTLKLR